MRSRPGNRRRSIVTLSRGKYNARVAKNGSRKRVATRTRTATKRARKLNQGVHETRGGSESAYTLTYKNRGMGRMISKLQKLQFTANSSAIYSQGAGLQGVNEEYTLFDAFDAATLMTQTITQQYGGATPTGFKTEKIWLHKVKAEYAYNNNTNDQVRITLYNYVPKKDIYGTNASGVVDASSGSNAWFLGLQHQGISGSSVNQVVGQTPFGSEMFCHFFTITKVTNIVLAPGQTHYHRVNFSPNKVISNELLQQGNLNLIKGLSLGQICVQYGAPCLSAVGTGVTTEATKILTTVKAEYSWSFLPNNMTTSTMSNTLPLTSTGAIENMVTGAAGTFAAV